MNEDAIWARLTEIFCDVLDDQDIVLTAETTANDVEEWDSLSNVILLVAIEQAFDGIKFSTGEIANLNNVGELIAVIQKQLARKSGRDWQG